MSSACWFRDPDLHRCGYCKNETGSISNGMWTEHLTVQDYQDLIDRGWRRSGRYCYKPIMDQTCCPQYTIKCDVLKFSLSKSQKKIIKKLNKYLVDGVLNKKDITSEAQYDDGPTSDIIFPKDRPDINFLEINNKSSEVRYDKRNRSIDEAHNSGTANETFCEAIACDTTELRPGPPKITNNKTAFNEGIGVDSSKPPCKKAKLLRLERKKEKLLKNGANFEKKVPMQLGKSVEQFLEEIPDNCKHKLRLELVPASEVKEIEFELYRKYQMVVHNDPPTKLTMKGFSRFLVHSPLEITLERMSKEHEFFEISAKLFKKYQIVIHNEAEDDCDEEQFDDFLVKSPLKPVKFPNGVDGLGYGSFHQQYWIDDKLIAVGVIDILPRCVSSVYFFYDPDYRNLTLGTYGAIREVQFTRSLQEKIPEISSYYMGFYIHSCPKMRYKGKLTPSFLLCPETYRWISIEKCLEKLEQNKYSRLEEDIDALDENVPTRRDIEAMKIYDSFKVIFFRDSKRYHIEYDLFSHIGCLIGKKCTNSITFYRNY